MVTVMHVMCEKPFRFAYSLVVLICTFGGIGSVAIGFLVSKSTRMQGPSSESRYLEGMEVEGEYVKNHAFRPLAGCLPGSLGAHSSWMGSPVLDSPRRCPLPPSHPQPPPPFFLSPASSR